MIESTTDISSEMKRVEAELEQNKSLCLESCCRVNEASKCSKMDIFNFQSVVCKNCTKLEINSLHNLKASMTYYVLTQYVSG